MAHKGLDAGKTFLAGVLAKLPVEVRGNVEALMADPTFVTTIGEGTLAQQEFSRLTNELATTRTELETQTAALAEREAGLESWHGELNTWYGANKQLVEEANAARKANGGKPPVAAPAGGPAGNGNPPASGLTEEQLEQRISQERAGFLGFQRDQNLLMRQHFTLFGEVLDIEPLLTHKQVGELGLQGVYQLVNKERLDKARTEAQAAHDKKVADEAVAAYATKQAQMPYMPPTGVGSGSPLDALKVGTPDALVDTAVAEYNRLQLERAGGTAGAGR